MGYERFQHEQRILRDELALDRTRLANERTMLAYVRTSIMFFVTGGTMLKLFGTSVLNLTTAWGVIGLGGLMVVIGALRFWQVKRSLRKLDELNTVGKVSE